MEKIQGFLNDWSMLEPTWQSSIIAWEISKKLLLEQGFKKDNLDNFVQNNPMVFCPNPTVTATEKKSKASYIPCSTDYTTMKDLVDKAKEEKISLE